MVWDLYLGNGFTTKHQKNNPHYKYAIAVLPLDTKVAQSRSSAQAPMAYEVLCYTNGLEIAAEWGRHS